MNPVVRGQRPPGLSRARRILRRAITALNIVAGIALITAPAAVFASTPVNAVCDYAGSSKCIYTDGSLGAVLSPYAGKIILPAGTTAITDEMSYHLTKSGPDSWFTVAGQYQLDLLQVGTSTTLQTLSYTVNTDLNAYPATVNTAPATVQLAPAVLTSALAHGGEIGYVLYINQSIAFRSGDINTSKNEIWYYGASGKISQAATNSHPFTAPTGIPVPAGAQTGALAGHIYDCPSVATTTEVTGGTIAVSGPTPELAAGNPVSYPTVLAGAYTLTATSPTNYHFVTCGSSVVIGPSSATVGVTVLVNGTGVGVFYVAPNPVTPPPPPADGTINAVVYLCDNGSQTVTAEPATITIAGTSAASGVPAPASVTTQPGTYNVVASNPAPGYVFVACGTTGGTGTATATSPVVVLAGGTSGVVFYETPAPADTEPTPSPTSSPTSTPSPDSGTNGVSTPSPSASPSHGASSTGGVNGTSGTGGVNGVTTTNSGPAAVVSGAGAAVAPTGGVLGAGTTMPLTGAQGLLRIGISIVCVALGVLILGTTYRRRQPRG